MSQRRILVLDDDPMIGQTISTIASFVGFDVRYVDDAVDFFTWLERWKPDLVVLDLIMPRMDGVEVIEELARRHSNVRTLLVSGVGERVLDAAARSAKEHGLRLQGVLSKPFYPEQLRALLAFSDEGWPASPDVAESGVRFRAPALTADDLRRALRRQELSVVYQPQVYCNTGELAGFEALLRWQHREWGAISPEIFISLAETHGLIDEVTVVLFREALHWFASIERELGAGTTLSLNVSALSLHNRGLLERCESFCSDLRLEAGRIVFEITESSVPSNATAALDMLTRLRMHGFQLSIDDFGTGYSTMQQLARLPFSEIKVDKSFVMSALQSREARTIVQSIIDLGKSLGMRTTAEGVEDRAVLELLSQAGCELAQGYLFARPMDASAVHDWLSRHRASLVSPPSLATRG